MFSGLLFLDFFLLLLHELSLDIFNIIRYIKCFSVCRYFGYDFSICQLLEYFGFVELKQFHIFQSCKTLCPPFVEWSVSVYNNIQSNIFFLQYLLHCTFNV